MSEQSTSSPSSDSALSRIVGVFFSPSKTFESIAARPTWLAPLLVWTVLSLAITVVLIPRMDFRDAVRQQLERSGQTVTDERVDAVAQQQRGIATAFGWAIGAISPAFIALLVTLVYWGAHKAFGRDMTFKQAFAVTTHAFLPSAFGSLLLIPILLQRESVNPNAIGDLVRSNLGVLVDLESKALHSLASSIDIFSFWAIALLSIGYAKAARSTVGQAAAIVITIWLIYVMAKAGLAAAGLGG